MEVVLWNTRRIETLALSIPQCCHKDNQRVRSFRSRSQRPDYPCGSCATVPPITRRENDELANYAARLYGVEWQNGILKQLLTVPYPGAGGGRDNSTKFVLRPMAKNRRGNHAYVLPCLIGKG